MGSPETPTPQQYLHLERAGQLAIADNFKKVQVKGSSADLSFNLPRQAVSLFVFEK
jgi:hypothetical protein